MRALGFNAFRLCAIAVACFTVSIHAGAGCDADPPATVPVLTPIQPAPVLIRKGFFMTAGGKRPGAEYFVWEKNEDNIYKRKQIVVTPVTTRNDGLAGGVQAAAWSDSFDPATNTFSPLPDTPTYSAGGAGVFLER